MRRHNGAYAPGNSRRWNLISALSVPALVMQARKQQRARRRTKASSRDVLGVAAAEEPIRPRWRKHFKNLSELRNELLHRQGDLTKDALEEQPTFSTHMADAGTDAYDRDFALGMLSSEQDALYEIEQAIERIRNGTYGRCELTGKPIEPERLEAIPWTRFTAAAEKQVEAEGALKRSRLGPRETVVKSEPSEKSGGEEEEV